METAVEGAAGGVFPSPPPGVAEPGAAHADVLADLAARVAPCASAEGGLSDGLSDGSGAIATLAMPGSCSFGGAFAFGAKKLAMERIPAAGCFGGAMSLACSGKKTERAAPADASRRA